MNTEETPTKTKRKTGPRPKKLVEATYTGIEVGRGENKKIIDPKEVERLAGMGCKNSEIALWLDIDDSTLQYNFKKELIKGRSNLNQSLRMAQIKYALNGSVPLLIWLGKNLLGQKDTIEIEQEPDIKPEDIDNRIHTLLKKINDEHKQPDTNGKDGTTEVVGTTEPIQEV